MDTFKSKIKHWVKLDNEIKELSKTLKDIKDQKSAVTENIYSLASEQDMLDTVIAISDGKMKFNKLKQPQALTLLYIELCLQDCISSYETVEYIMNHIKKSRQYTIREDIKRYYNKTI